MRTITLELYTPEERMPEEGEDVLFRYDEYGNFMTGIFDCGEFIQYGFSSGTAPEFIEEWAYMP